MNLVTLTISEVGFERKSGENRVALKIIILSSDDYDIHVRAIVPSEIEHSRRAQTVFVRMISDHLVNICESVRHSCTRDITVITRLR